MTEREKLIELLMQGELEADKQGIFNCSQSKWKAEIMADFLLENGVSILPCKVGDVLYYHDYKCGAFNDNKDEWNIVDSVVCQIRIKKKGILVEMSSGRIFTHKDFGKIIFNTKEEAEKVLAERGYK